MVLQYLSSTQIDTLCRRIITKQLVKIIRYFLRCNNFLTQLKTIIKSHIITQATDQAVINHINTINT